eukprot:1901161-Amphidinium_carterae.1
MKADIETYVNENGDLCSVLFLDKKKAHEVLDDAAHAKACDKALDLEKKCAALKALSGQVMKVHSAVRA